MEELGIYGMEELTQTEMKEINGGNIFVDLYWVGRNVAAIGVTLVRELIGSFLFFL